MIDYSSVLCDRIQDIPYSGIRKFFDIAAEMDDVISLGIGEPDFQTPWHIRDAGIYSLQKGFTKYTPNAGLTDLRKSISLYLKRRFDLNYDPLKQILVTVGGSEGLDLALRCLINQGDEIIIPTPSFVCYAPLTTIQYGKPVYVQTKAENEFRLTAEELQAAITPKTKALLLPFPNNPTGAIMEKSDLQALAKVLKDTNIMIISDEIYAELTYGQKHVSPANLPELYDRTIVINGFSKAYSMTGWRLGYVAGPEPIVNQMTKLHQYGIMSAPTTSQYAAIEAMEKGDADIEDMRDEYDGRRRYLLSGFRKLGFDCFEPKGAFYMFPCIKSTGLTSDEFAEQLLTQQHVAVIPGTAFGPGGEGYVRTCYAVSIKDLGKALKKIELFVADLKH